MKQQDRTGLPADVRDEAGKIAHAAQRFTTAYYEADPDWVLSLAELRVAMLRLEEFKVRP